MRIRSSIKPCSLVVLILVWSMTDASVLLGEGLIEKTSLQEVSDCYSGEYSSAEKFLAHSLSQFPRLEGDEEFKKQQINMYERMRKGDAGIDCVWMTYGVDGYDVHGFIVAPEGASEGTVQHPTVILLLGGNADSGRVSLIRLVNMAFPLVRKGFVVVGTSYRGAAKSRREPNPDRLADEFGGQDLNDVLALLPLVDALPFTDGNRVGLWGVSRGAMMAYLAARESDRFSALIAMSGPVDLEKELEFRPEMEERVLSVWIPDFEARREDALRERSVVHWVDELSDNTAILILHGTADKRVRPQGALELALRLQESGKSYRLIMYDGASHSLREVYGDAFDQIVKWFTRHLRDE